MLASTSVPFGAIGASSPSSKTFALTVAPASVAATSSAGPPEAVGRTIHRAPDGLFYTSAIVNGKAVRFIIDTGSNVVVLTKVDAARIGMANAPAGNDALQTVGGSAPGRRGYVDRLIVAGQSLDDVDAITVDSGLTVSLLGQSALSRLQSLKFEGDRLELN
ncbi:TIGR02281 family clan AA aspartic protease [Sphingomonas sp. RB3P16]|uniref:retropepsin-like aspartic protease family protein n=1 Tax=Parasphingomonas frigoris TaxID=3096163 RepID=UPI002FCB0599